MLATRRSPNLLACCSVGIIAVMVFGMFRVRRQPRPLHWYDAMIVQCPGEG